MAGDESCTRIRSLSYNRIMCINKKGEETGYRNAMTDQQLLMYQQRQQQQQPQRTNTVCNQIGTQTFCNSY